MSPLAQGRGLKPRVLRGLLFSQGSPLAQGRGLKQCSMERHGEPPGSPLAQGRGLKLDPGIQRRGFLLVAPRTGAWIETFCSCAARISNPSRPSHRGVD